MRACAVGLVTAAVIGLLLGGCAKRDPIVTTAGATANGNWLIERQVDRVTGTQISSARLVTRNSSNGTIAFPQPAELQLTCFKGQPIVRLAFNFKIGTNRNSTLGYSFDNKPGREANGRFLQDHSTVVIEDQAEITQFVRELAASRTLYVRIRSLNAARSSAEFQLDGASTAIEAGYAGCPVTPQRTAEVGSMARSATTRTGLRAR